MELESFNFKEEDIKAFKCTTQNTLEFDWLNCIVQNPSTLSNSLCKMCKIIDCKILVIENVAFAVDLGMIEPFGF